MQKSKKIKIILIVLIAIFIAIMGIRLLIVNNKETSKKYTSLSEINDVEEIIKFMNCEYIKEEESKDSNYKKDIYLKFSKDLYTNGDESNRDFYENTIIAIAKALSYQNFRLIDDSRELLIEIQCSAEEEKITKIYINGDDNYFSRKDSLLAASDYKKDSSVGMLVNSPELEALLQNNWSSKNINFGTAESKFNNYDIYFDEGIEVRVISQKVFNIVFTENYKNSVVGDIKVNTSFEEITKKLGTPTFGIVGEDYTIGYKGDEFYVFFSENNISVYRVEKQDNTLYVAHIIEKFNNDKIVSGLLNGFTDLWNDYDKYEIVDEKYINLVYSLRGIKIQFNITRNHGVIICKNFNGLVAENVNLETMVKDNSKIPNNVYLDTETDTVYEAEQERVNFQLSSIYSDYGEVDEDIPKYFSTKFKIVYLTDSNNQIYYLQVASSDRKNPSSSVNMDSYITSVEWMDDDNLVYGIKNSGLFVYNAITGKTIKIIDGKGDFYINYVSNNEIFYDDTSIKLTF